MEKKNLCFGVAIFILLQSSAFFGCASVKPMNNETMWTYGLLDNLELFKNYQYFVSRDIVLTSTNVDRQTDIKSGQAYSSTSVQHDVKQILSSTPGVALQVRPGEEVVHEDGATSVSPFMLGIAFESDNDNVLWFYYSLDDCFYLAYTNYDRQEIAYAGTNYQVAYEQGSGIGATVKRLTTTNKTKEGNYENRDPLLLYEENAKVKETETRKTIQGRRL
jgi:hypothetical protein